MKFLPLLILHIFGIQSSFLFAFDLPFSPARRICVFSALLRQLLKSKIHRALVTDANVDYEGSITIPTDLMAESGLWEGEKVLVTSITNGARLETYVIPGPEGSGQIVINGAAAHLINTGHRVTIMSWGLSAEPVEPLRLLLNARNEVVSRASK